jgi:hypothetical protein
MDDAEIRRQIMTKLAVDLWPTTGKALGLGRSATYDAAREGKIKTIDVGHKKPVPTAWLRQVLGLDGPKAA